MANRPYITVPYLAGGTIAPNRIVKIGAADATVIQATAATEALVGVAVQNITASTGDRVDVVIGGQYEIEAGGSISRGGWVTSDASGKAVAASPGAGTNNGVIGIACADAASGDFVTVQLAPGTRQG